MVVLLYKEVLFNTNQLDISLPSSIVSLMKEFEDVFPEEISKALPPIRGIEHEIDFAPGATISNRPDYWSNSKETKELQNQVGEFMEKWIPHVKFAYNHTIHSATKFFPFGIVYGFNSLTPLDLSPLPMYEHANLDGKKKTKFVKQTHGKARLNIEQRTKQYAKQANKGRRGVFFKPGDCVWVHMRKE